jgi:hypothetical protein
MDSGSGGMGSAPDTVDSSPTCSVFYYKCILKVTPPVTSRSFAFGQVRRLDGLADVEPIF